jgi:hypothetical protein
MRSALAQAVKEAAMRRRKPETMEGGVGPPEKARRRRSQRRNYKRPLFEELVSLDARWLARHHMIPKDWSRRIYPNFAFVIPHIATLILTARTAEIISCDGQEQTVAIHWQHNGGIGYNSIRPMFVCRCGYGAFRLYDVYGALRCYCCATALGIRYASQQVSRKGRKYLQSQRLRRFLGEYPGLSTIRKPLFMHRKTYSALLTKLRHIETNPESRKYKSKRLTEHTLKPTNMYQVEVAHIADV